jgi:hypothetical protein
LTNVSSIHYTLYIHGKEDDLTRPGDYTDFSYWGSSNVAAGVNKKAVNWHGTQKIGVENYRIRDALDCFCTGNNWCYVAVHSAGALQIEYALSLHGGSTRNKKNATPNAQGVCGDAGGTQMGSAIAAKTFSRACRFHASSFVVRTQDALFNSPFDMGTS